MVVVYPEKKLNVKLLQKIKKQILAAPETFEMQEFIQKERESYSDETFEGNSWPSCGTVCCIGGWADVFQQMKEKGTRSLKKISTAYRGDLKMAEILGLPYEKWQEGSVYGDCKLFYVEDWPEKYQEKWEKARTSRGKARVAADLIDEVCKKGGIWWRNYSDES